MRRPPTTKPREIGAGTSQAFVDYTMTDPAVGIFIPASTARDRAALGDVCAGGSSKENDVATESVFKLGAQVETRPTADHAAPNDLKQMGDDSIRSFG